MYTERKQDLSVLSFLKTLYADAPFINVVDGFPEEEFVLPTVALELDTIDTYNLEMGSRAFGKIRTWYIDVYATTKAQRDEIAYRLLYALENKITVFDYDQGFDNPPVLGALDPENVQLRIIKVLPDLTELMYYRAVVQFTAVYEDV